MEQNNQLQISYRLGFRLSIDVHIIMCICSV